MREGVAYRYRNVLHVAYIGPGRADLVPLCVRHAPVGAVAIELRIDRLKRHWGLVLPRFLRHFFAAFLANGDATLLEVGVLPDGYLRHELPYRWIRHFIHLIGIDEEIAVHHQPGETVLYAMVGG